MKWWLACGGVYLARSLRLSFFIRSATSLWLHLLKPPSLLSVYISSTATVWDIYRERDIDDGRWYRNLSHFLAPQPKMKRRDTFKLGDREAFLCKLPSLCSHITSSQPKLDKVYTFSIRVIIEWRTEYQLINIKMRWTHTITCCSHHLLADSINSRHL